MEDEITHKRGPSEKDQCIYINVNYHWLMNAVTSKELNTYGIPFLEPNLPVNFLS